MADLRDRVDRADRAGIVGALAELPGAAQILCLLLQVAPGHVEADGVAPDTVQRLLDRDVLAALAEEGDELDLEMIVLGLRRIGVLDGLALRHELQGVGRLHEEERRFAGRIAAHLARMRRVVAPDAIDAADREGVGRARDRDGGTLRFGDDGGHGFP